MVRTCKWVPFHAALLGAVFALSACGAGVADEETLEGVDESSDSALNSDIYARARAYAAANPTRDGGSWNQWCGALMVRFGQLPASSVRASAILAYRDSRIVSTDPSKALTGAFHWWDIGAYGHVGADLNGGGRQVFMATRNLDQSWGDAIGISSVAGYTSKTGARYLGWSMDYAGGRIAGGGAAPVNVSGPAGSLPRTLTEYDGIPGAIYYKRIQTVGRRDFGYTGVIDGVTGLGTELARVKITARELNRRGGPRTSAQEDGIPGKIYWTRVQTVGRQSFGYTGAIDGIPGPATYRVAHRICGYAVNRAF